MITEGANQMQRWKYCQIMVPVVLSKEHDTGPAYLVFLQDGENEELEPKDVGRMIGQLGLGGWELTAVFQEGGPLFNDGQVFGQAPMVTIYIFKQPIEG